MTTERKERTEGRTTETVERFHGALVDGIDIHTTDVGIPGDGGEIRRAVTPDDADGPVVSA